MRSFDAPARGALWPDCVREMVDFEARAGGEDAPDRGERSFRLACENLGMIPRSVLQEAIVAAIPRLVVPRLSSLGVCTPAAQI
jgi:hypothetical protein